MMRRSLLCLMVLLATGLLTGASVRAAASAPAAAPPAPHVSTGASVIQQARERIAARDMSGALALMQAYVRTHPTLSAPLEFLGDLYYRSGKLSLAESAYNHVLLLAPDNRGAHNRLGSVYAAQNKLDAAIAQFQLSLPAISAVDNLVALHERKGDLRTYRSSVELKVLNNPNNAAYMTELGQIYAALYEPLKAIEQYRAALNTEPTLVPAINALGLAYLGMNDNAQAAVQFQHCLKILPHEYACENNLAAAYIGLQKDDLAEPILQGAYHYAPERPQAMVNLGYIADDRGDWKTAIADYASAISVGPYARSGYFDLAVEYEAHKLYPLAQAALLKGLAIAPNDGWMHYLLGRTYADQGEAKLARAQYRAAIASLNPDASTLARSALVAGKL